MTRAHARHSVGGLEGAGWSVIEAPCRQDAIDKLTHNHLGLILVDLHMSDLNGFTLIRALRRRAEWKDVPVIALTSRDLTPDECERLEGLAQQVIHTDGDPQSELAAELHKITASFPGASAVLVAMHWLFSGIAVRWHGFGQVIKGCSEVLIREGRVDENAMRGAHMTEHDLWEDLRGKSVSELKQVSQARLERSGQLSVVKTKKEPEVFDLSIADGVQIVRIEIAS
jgi:CheY-like chemotaxis protein